MEFNVYIDGTWLFNQCAPSRIFANRMELPQAQERFPLDFSRLLNLLAEELTERLGGNGVRRTVPTTGSLFFYMAIFDIPPDPDPAWGDIETIRRGSVARRQFAGEAIAAGFSPDGVFTVQLRGWIVNKVRERRYQEKMVDTSLVGRLVERAIAGDRELLHVVISGDIDILPAITTVVPDYTERVVLAITHPDAYDRAEAQTSFGLNEFRFEYEPIYLERDIGQLLPDYHYRCSNRNCQRDFVRERPIPSGENPFCRSCRYARPTRAGS